MYRITHGVPLVQSNDLVRTQDYTGLSIIYYYYLLIYCSNIPLLTQGVKLQWISTSKSLLLKGSVETHEGKGLSSQPLSGPCVKVHTSYPLEARITQ